MASLRERAALRWFARANATEIAFWCSIVSCFLLLACSISASSLWIDEGYIAWVVHHDSLRTLAAALADQGIRPADRQYPLYDVWEWSWVQLFGIGEYSLRAANLPFGAIYVLALAFTSRYVFNRRFAWMPFTFAPFVWFYMNEARPYMMLTAFATCAIGSIVAYAFGSTAVSSRALPLILPSVFAMWLTHILAIVLAPGLLVILLAARAHKDRLLWSAWRKSILAWVLPFFAVTAFYGVTLIGNGARDEMANNQNRGPSPLTSVAEIVYEQLGFGGLGPPRNMLRTGLDIDDVRPFLPWITLGVLGISCACFPALRRRPQRTASILFAAWAASVVFALATAEIMHARFLGRHLAATMPLLLFFGISIVTNRLGLVAFSLVFALSDFRITVLPTYARDDYRGVVADLANRVKARPGIVDWAADDITGSYYGLQFTNLQSNKGALEQTQSASGLGHGLSVLDVAELSPGAVDRLLTRQRSCREPVYLVLTKPDIFDEFGGWTAQLDGRKARLISERSAFRTYSFEPVSSAGEGSKPKLPRCLK